MNQSTTGQVIATAAQIYEDFYLPALFARWAPIVADAAHVEAGQQVLDVACGTGVLARYVAQRVGVNGKSVGLDRNEGMLAVAKSKGTNIEWHQGTAERLLFDNHSFDAVVSQFGLMFFTDRVAALREMARVVRPGGYVAVAVWDSLENTPGYAAVVALLRRLFGEAAAETLRAPYCLGDKAELMQIFSDAGLDSASIETIRGIANFPSIDAWIQTDVNGWTLADMLDDNQVAHLLTEAKRELQPFVNNDGTVSFEAPAHIVSVNL